MLLRHVAVAVFRSVIEQFLEPFMPFINSPLETDAVEPIDAILLKRTSRLFAVCLPDFLVFLASLERRSYRAPIYNRAAP